MCAAVCIYGIMTLICNEETEMKNRNTVAGLVAGVVLALAGGAVAKEWPGFSVGMGMGGWLTNYKRFNVLPEDKRLDITKGDLAHFHHRGRRAARQDVGLRPHPPRLRPDRA